MLSPANGLELFKKGQVKRKRRNKQKQGIMKRRHFKREEKGTKNRKKERANRKRSNTISNGENSKRKET